MKKILAIILVLCCILPVSAKKRQNEEIITSLTQLEKRQFQTRTYSAQDNIIAMKALLNVLQDEGFIVYNVNSLLGYIYGVKDFDISDPNIDISKEFGVTKSRLNYNGVKVATLEVSANITLYGQKSRIRVNFKRKLLNEYGNAQMIDDIDNAEYYADFYAKVDSAIAMQKQINSDIKKAEPLKKEILESKPEETKKTEEYVKPESSVEQEDTVEIDQPQQEIQETNEPEVIEDNQDDEVPTTGENTPETDDYEQYSMQDNEETVVKTSKQEAKELKQLIKQTKAEAKQAQKEEAEAQKLAKKEAKRLAKEASETQKIEEKEAKRAEKEAIKAQKIEEKEAKQAEKEAIKAQKIEEREAKQASKEAIKAQKKAEKEAKRNAKEIQE